MAMAMANPNHGMVADMADQQIWADRIRKEERVHTKINRECFSVRNAVTSQGVPAKFKPGHIDPWTQKGLGGFDPRAIGWDPNGKLAKEVVRTFLTQSHGPRERHLFPETTQEEMGWLLTQATDKSMRKSLAGALPKCGVGWPDRNFLPNADDKIKRQGRPKPKRIQPIPPYAVTTDKAREAAAASMKKSKSEVQANPPIREGSTLSATAPLARTGVKKGASSVLSAAAPSQLSRATSVPAMSSLSSCAPPAGETPEFLQQEQDLFGALARAKQFHNGQTSCKWYHPLSHSDVAQFADHYTKVWKGQLFHQRGSGPLG
mmetsp:Transcript_27371/g.63868  ORF Transcript_27371/g.63868 Transcript_27371/m.63868 type:complete len:318 (-) Transcript_27371:116-1069(-)